MAFWLQNALNYHVMPPSRAEACHVYHWSRSVPPSLFFSLNSLPFMITLQCWLHQASGALSSFNCSALPKSDPTHACSFHSNPVLLFSSSLWQF